MIDIMTARKMTEQAKENQIKVKIEKHFEEIESAIKMAALEGKNCIYYKKCDNKDEMSTIIRILEDLSYKAEQFQPSTFDSKWTIKISW